MQFLCVYPCSIRLLSIRTERLLLPTCTHHPAFSPVHPHLRTHQLTDSCLERENDTYVVVQGTKNKNKKPGSDSTSAHVITLLRQSNRTHLCLVAIIEAYRGLYTGAIYVALQPANERIINLTPLISTRKPREALWGTYLCIVSYCMYISRLYGLKDC